MRENIKDTNRSNEMLAKKKDKWKSGEFTGPKAQWGYCIEHSPNRHLIVDEKVNEMIKMIFELAYCRYYRIEFIQDA